jgi:hypothetical protein
MLYWYSFAAPDEPPEPPVPVTVPVLKPAQIMLAFTGEAILSVGAIGVDPTVQVLSVLHAEFEQPLLPPVLRD